MENLEIKTNKKIIKNLDDCALFIVFSPQE